MDRIDIDRMGSTVKSARIAKGLTRERFAEVIKITPRYLMSIENEHKKPSFNVLYKLVRELGISADIIFYPEMTSNNADTENLIKLLYLCSQHEINVVTATVEALLNK